MLSVFLIYTGSSGVPVTIGRLDEPQIVRHVADLAVEAIDARATSLQAADAGWAELERIEAFRLRAMLDAVLGPAKSAEPEPAQTASPDDSMPPGVM